MPRIRKKTSNRQNTRDRAKIRKKVSEHGKKSKRDSKRNTTWKSKKKADPGIPNSFHLKDQVLAELAAEKRQEEEAKIARKEASKTKAPVAEEEEEDTPGIATISSKVLTAKSAAKAPLTKVIKVPAAVEEEIPSLVDTHLSTLQDVIDRADVILEVVDARDINGGRSGFLEGMIKDAGSKLVIVVNKADLVPRETLAKWLDHLPPSTHLFSSLPFPSSAASTSSTPHSASPGRRELLASLKSWSEAKDDPLVVALMGLPSVGKTSVLNALLPAAQTKYAVAPLIPLVASARNPEPTTKVPVEVSLSVEGKEVRVIDTPGWEYAEDDAEEDAEEVEEAEEDQAKWDELEERVAGDMLRRNLGRVDRVKDATPLVNWILKRSNSQDLMTCYNLPFFQEGDVDAFLTALARATGNMRKGDQPHLEGAARVILRDWAVKTFPYYSTPPQIAGSTDEAQKGEKVDMARVLEHLKTRKEMRSTGRGMIRFKPSEVDSRDLILDDDYTAMEAESDDDEEDEADDEEAEEELVGDVDDEAEDDEEDGEDDGQSLNSETERFLLDAAQGEELDLEDGSEPESGSDVEENDSEDVDEEEDEVVVLPRKNKRKATESPVSARMKRKRVSFGGSVKSNGNGAAKRKREDEEEVGEIKGILKASRSVKPVPKKSMKAAAVKESAASLRKDKKLASQPKREKTKVVAKTADTDGDEAYDFSKHF